MEEIYKRRSIRSYNDKKISNEDMLSLVKAGMNAPSSKNSRPSEFIIIEDENLMKKLSEVSLNMFMLGKCDKAIVVMGLEKTEFWQQDMAASTQNILLEATRKNIASCWMGVAPIKDYEEHFREILNIPNEKRVLSIISLGYTDKEKEANNFFDKSKLYYNKLS